MMQIDGYTRLDDGSYLRDEDGVCFKNLEAVYETVVQQWKLSRSYIALFKPKLDAAKLGVKELSAVYMEETFPEARVYVEMEKIEKTYDALLRQIVLAQYAQNPEVKFFGTNTRKTKGVEINLGEAIAWAWVAHPEWITLTPEALKEIKESVTDRMHPMAGLVPAHVAKYVDVIGPVIKDADLLDGTKKSRDDLI